MTRSVLIKNRVINENSPTFIIAEIGINHGGNLSIAEELINLATQSGADAVKFQTYITEKRVPKDSPVFDILKQCELSHDDQSHLKQLADNLDVIFFSTPFDHESVDFLIDLNVPVFKIASFDLVNLALLRKVATSGMPIIASRGMANKQEVNTAVEIFQEYDVPYILLHCISSYPTPDDQANLNVIHTLKKMYDCPVGYSDHTLGIDVPVYAVATGSQVIEKHFTYDKSASGPDHRLSANPDEFSEMVNKIRKVESILGKTSIKMYSIEENTLIYRRPSK